MVLLPGDRGPRHLGLLRLAGLPARGAGAPDARGARRPRAAAGHGRPRDPGRAQPQPARDDAQGARRRRCRPPGARRLGGHRPAVGLRRGALRAGRARPASASSSAMLDYLDTDGCRMRFLREQLDDPEAADCGRCDNCGGLTPRRDRVRPPRSRRPAPDWPGPASRSSRARCGRPRWPTSASTSRARSPSPPRRAAPSPGSPTSATGRRCATLFRPDTPDGPVPVPLVQAVLDAARRLAPRGRRDRGGRVGDPTDADRRPRRRAVPPPPGAGGRPVGDRRPRRRARAGARPTPPSGSPRSGAAATLQADVPDGRAGAAGRRPGRHRLDAHPRRPGPPRGRRRGGAPADPGGAELRRAVVPSRHDDRRSPRHREDGRRHGATARAARPHGDRLEPDARPGRTAGRGRRDGGRQPVRGGARAPTSWW